jgi:hypothetical protein
MHFRKIKNCGMLGIDFVNLRTPCEGRTLETITKSFLSKLVKNCVIRATSYSDKTAKGDENYRDYIYRYSEKPLHSIICPSLADITPIFMIEQPSTRKPRGRQAYSGHIDYRVSYKDATYIIELKYARLTYGKKPKDKVKDNFEKAIEQISHIKRSEMEFLCQKNDKYYLRIALEWITFRKGSKEGEKLENSDTEQIKMSFDQLRKINTLKTANMFALWLPEERLRKPIEYTNKFVKYPAVGFIAKVL